MFLSFLWRRGIRQAARPLIFTARRGCLNYPLKIKELVQSYNPTSIEQTAKTLDYLLSMREYMPKAGRSSEGLVDRIVELLKKSPASRITTRIYESLAAMKLNSYRIKNLVAGKVAEAIESHPSMSAQLIDMAYFLLTVMPYHSQQLVDLTTKSIALSEFEGKAKGFRDEVGYVAYSKVAVLLKSAGFVADFPEPASNFNIGKPPIEQILQLAYNLSLLTPDKSQFPNRLLERYLQADSVRYDKYLHKIENIDIDQQKNMSTDVFDVISWHEVSLLCRTAGTFQEVDEQNQFKIGQVIDRKLETENVDFYTAVSIISFATSTELPDSAALINRCLESVRELEEGEKQDIMLDSIVDMLRLVREKKINDDFFEFFAQEIPRNRLEYSEETVSNLRELYRNRNISEKLRQFLKL